MGTRDPEMERSPERNRCAPAPTLMLLNGAPGSGKSTLAAMLAADRPMTFALDIDTLNPEELEQLAADCGARFIEVALILDESTLAQRLAGRREAPDRAEQEANDRFVSPDDAPELVRSIEEILALRPSARRIDGWGSRDEVLAALAALLRAG